MDSVDRIYRKVIVEQFYQRNAGLFLFFFFVMFGIVEGKQLIFYHLSLIYGILDSAVLMSLVFIVWSLYAFKCIQFTLALFSRSQNSFLYTTTALPPGRQYRDMLLCQALNFLPIELYMLAVVGVGFSSGQVVPALAAMIFVAMLVLVATWIVVRRINSPHERPSAVSRSILPAWKKSIPEFYLAYIANDLKLIFFITKAFSFFALIGFFQIDVGHYEIRTTYMGFLMGIVAHAVLIFEFRKWEDSYLTFTKNLPVPLWKRFSNVALVYFFLLLPELMLMPMNGVGWMDLPGLLLFGVSLLLFQHCLLYAVSMNMDRYIQRVLILFLITFGLILFQLYLLVPVVAIIASGRWFTRKYYAFEALRL